MQFSPPNLPLSTCPPVYPPTPCTPFLPSLLASSLITPCISALLSAHITNGMTYRQERHSRRRSRCSWRWEQGGLRGRLGVIVRGDHSRDVFVELASEVLSCLGSSKAGGRKAMVRHWWILNNRLRSLYFYPEGNRELRKTFLQTILCYIMWRGRGVLHCTGINCCFSHQVV